jgi:hypothetical protein
MSPKLKTGDTPRTYDDLIRHFWAAFLSSPVNDGSVPGFDQWYSKSTPEARQAGVAHAHKFASGALPLAESLHSLRSDLSSIVHPQPMSPEDHARMAELLRCLTNSL